MRANFRGDRPFHGRDLGGGGGAIMAIMPPPPPGRSKTSNSPALLGLTTFSQKPTILHFDLNINLSTACLTKNHTVRCIFIDIQYGP